MANNRNQQYRDSQGKFTRRTGKNEIPESPEKAYRRYLKARRLYFFSLKSEIIRLAEGIEPAQNDEYQKITIKYLRRCVTQYEAALK